MMNLSNTTVLDPEGDENWIDVFPWVQATDIMRLVSLLVTPFGFFANYLCFITAAQMPQSNSAYLMRYLAVSDCTVVLLNGIIRLGVKYFGIALENINGFLCKCVMYEAQRGAIATTYLIAAMAMDRVFAIKFPFWHRNHSSQSSAAKVAAAMIGVGCTVPITVFYFFDINNKDECILMTKNFPVFRKYYNFIGSIVLYFLVPFCLLIFANIVFAISLVTRKMPNVGNGQQSEASAKKEKERMDAQRSYVIMLMCLTISFLAFTMTTATVYVVRSNFAEAGIYQDLTDFLRDLTPFSLLMNSSLNIVFYWMSGRMFQQALKKAWKDTFMSNK